jgi:hypothetical protein
VLTLAGLGITQDRIANLMRLAPETLRLHYLHGGAGGHRVGHQEVSP